MSILYTILVILHVIISIVLVVAVLMQRAKGGGLAGIAGGASSQAVFGGRGAATMIHKATVILALIFGLNSLAMAVIYKNIGSPVSVTQESMQQEADPLQKYFQGEGGEGSALPEGGDAPTLPAMGGEQSAQPREGAPAPQGGESRDGN
ncbi:preprotein translocase subunit SecG [bacterium]|nr:preprotein translocase subunit SecG [bacterium]